MQGSWSRRISILICCLGAAVLLVMMSGLLRSAGTLGLARDPGTVGLSQVTPTSTFCPVSTPEPPPSVDPLISPTNLFSQTITVLYNRSEAITLTGESGVFAVHAGDEDWSQPARVDIRLLRNTAHHLEVDTRVPEYYIGDCYYSSYTLDTTVDRNGDPLVIEQVSPPMGYKFFLPVFIRTGSTRE